MIIIPPKKQDEIDHATKSPLGPYFCPICLLIIPLLAGVTSDLVTRLKCSRTTQKHCKEPTTSSRRGAASGHLRCTPTTWTWAILAVGAPLYSAIINILTRTLVNIPDLITSFPARLRVIVSLNVCSHS